MAALVAGEPRIDMHLEWQMTPLTEPRWNVRGCYITTIEGDPMILREMGDVLTRLAMGMVRGG